MEFQVGRPRAEIPRLGAAGTDRADLCNETSNKVGSRIPAAGIGRPIRLQRKVYTQNT